MGRAEALTAEEGTVQAKKIRCEGGDEFIITGPHEAELAHESIINDCVAALMGPEAASSIGTWP